MKKFLYQFIFQGKIPYLLLLKKVLFWIAVISPLSVFFLYREFDDFGSLGWNLLIAVLLVRPLADILPEFKILRALIAFRREFGIAFAIPVLLTSNTFSMKLLRKRWKTVQRLSYFFFFFGGVHIFLVREESGLIGILIVGTALILAKKGLKIEVLPMIHKIIR